MRRSYDRYRRRGWSWWHKIVLVVLVLGVIFLFRDHILQYLDENPDTAQYVPEVVTSALERDLADWQEEDLQARATQLSVEVQAWQDKLAEATEQGQDKLEAVKTNLNQAREALEETKAALDKLGAAGASLKESVTVEASAAEE